MLVFWYPYLTYHYIVIRIVFRNRNLERIKFGNQINGSWICNDCMTADDAASTIQDDSNSIIREHIGDASKSDVSTNTPPADEVDL